MKELTEEKLREEYTIKSKTGLDEALKLDKKVQMPAFIFTYIYGILGTLLLGVGMCLAMEVIGNSNLKVLGIFIGLIGIFIISSNYPIYKKIMNSRKEKYASRIILALNKNN